MCLGLCFQRGLLPFVFNKCTGFDGGFIAQERHQDTMRNKETVPLAEGDPAMETAMNKEGPGLSFLYLKGLVPLGIEEQ